jgi:phage recombination protein Bet
VTDQKALQTRPEGGALEAAEDFETLRAAVGPDLTKSQLKLALVYAQKVGADLFARQIYPVVDRGRLIFMASIDFLRVIAERSGKYAGQGAPEYEEGCDCQGQAVPLMFPHPVWAQVPIHRKGWELPIVRRAYFHEYVPLNREGKPRETWVKMPHVMLAKVSEAAGIRAAFPNDVQGLYTDDEMEQAHNATPIAESPHSAMPPPDAPKPTWGEHEATVREAPDGVRRVKTPEWATGIEAKQVQKLEVKGKLGRRYVTIILLDALADAAGENLERLHEGASLVLDGQRHEHEFQPRDSDQKKKALQIRNVTRMAVETDDGWLELGVPTEEPEPEPEPPHPAEPPLEVIEGQAEEVPLPPEPEAPKASSTSAGDGSTTPDSPPSGDLRAQAEDAFGDMLDADVDPGRGGNPQVGAGWEELPVATGEAGSAVSLEGYFARGELTDVPGREGKRMYDGWVTSLSMDERIHVVMAENVAQKLGADRLGAGEQVYLRGVWRHPGGEPVILADSLRPA